MTKYKYRLKKGDMIVNQSAGVYGILTRETRKFWYYFFREKVCRVRKLKLWEGIDSCLLGVEYGSSMKYRRKKKDNRILDLHDTSHEEVEEKVKRYLNWVELPTTIITGDSERMKDAVKVVVEEYGWQIYQDPSNYGRIIILEGR